MPEIVFDTCVTSNFALAGALGILEGLYRNKAYITDIVSIEILRGIRSGHARLEAIPKAVQAGWLKETALRSGKERGLFETLSVSLGLGEASSIAVAKRRGFHFASDDWMARAEAARLGVPLTGTLGILVKAARADVCDLAKNRLSPCQKAMSGFGQSFSEMWERPYSRPRATKLTPKGSVWLIKPKDQRG